MVIELISAALLFVFCFVLFGMRSVLNGRADC